MIVGSECLHRNDYVHTVTHNLHPFSLVDSPNSCGQVQVADIGLMGAPAKKMDEESGKAVPGCNIFVGGRVGEDAHLSLEPYKKGVPLDEEDLLPVLLEILKTEFGAVEK